MLSSSDLHTRYLQTFYDLKFSGLWVRSLSPRICACVNVEAHRPTLHFRRGPYRLCRMADVFMVLRPCVLGIAQEAQDVHPFGLGRGSVGRPKPAPGEGPRLDTGEKQDQLLMLSWHADRAGVGMGNRRAEVSAVCHLPVYKPERNTCESS